LRQVLLELVPLAEAYPQEALALCDALWEEGTLEYRLLAAGLLGTVPPKPVEPVLKRVEAWCLSNTENRLINALLTDGMARLRKEAPAEVILQIKAWLESGRFFTQQLGLRSLLPILSKQDDETLPVFYRLLTPLVRVAPANLRPDLLDVLRGLARRSPRETAYFLRQTLELPNSPDTPWLIRQCAAEFPSELQASLRAATRVKERQS
jgi:hypothetical protein